MLAILGERCFLKRGAIALENVLTRRLPFLFCFVVVCLSFIGAPFGVKYRSPGLESLCSYCVFAWFVRFVSLPCEHCPANAMSQVYNFPERWPVLSLAWPSSVLQFPWAGYFCPCCPCCLLLCLNGCIFSSKLYLSISSCCVIRIPVNFQSIGPLGRCFL